MRRRAAKGEERERERARLRAKSEQDGGARIGAAGAG